MQRGDDTMKKKRRGDGLHDEERRWEANRKEN